MNSEKFEIWTFYLSVNLISQYLDLFVQICHVDNPPYWFVYVPVKQYIRWEKRFLFSQNKSLQREVHTHSIRTTGTCIQKKKLFWPFHHNCNICYVAYFIWHWIEIFESIRFFIFAHRIFFVYSKKWILEGIVFFPRKWPQLVPMHQSHHRPMVMAHNVHRMCNWHVFCIWITTNAPSSEWHQFHWRTFKIVCNVCWLWHRPGPICQYPSSEKWVIYIYFDLAWKNSVCLGLAVPNAMLYGDGVK